MMAVCTHNGEGAFINATGKKYIFDFLVIVSNNRICILKLELFNYGIWDNIIFLRFSGNQIYSLYTTSCLCGYFITRNLMSRKAWVLKSVSGRRSLFEIERHLLDAEKTHLPSRKSKHHLNYFLWTSHLE